MNHRRSTHLLLAAAAVAAPALLTACGEGASSSPDVRVAGAPTTAATAGAAATTDGRQDRVGGVTPADLLTDADTVYEPGHADWFAVSTSGAAGDLLFMTCAATGLADTGATSVAAREFELRNLEPGAPEVRGESLVQVVAEYDDRSAATRAWSTINGWLTECSGHPDGVTDYRALQTRKVAVDGADAVVTDAHYGPVPAALDPDGHAAFIQETGVARVGNRVAVLSSVVVGQDYDFVGATPVERMLRPAVDRLRD